MSNYFDRVEVGMCTAVEARAHRPWHVRARRLARAHMFAVVFASLVVATPAVGAVTNWFGLGAPDHFPAQSATQFAGRPLPASSQLLALRAPDPQRGPPWSLRLVHTTRGDTCVQLGRVEVGKLGSLGIDEAWNNDHLFHPFPNTSEGEDCGTTDAVGNGFLNVSYTGEPSSANPTTGAKGPQAKSCSPVLYFLIGPRSSRHRLLRHSGQPTCPRGSGRIVFMGLLGPDATSVTYEAPDRALKTHRTSGKDGAYLLVFPENRATCKLYTEGPLGSYGPCGGSGSQGGAGPEPTGAVKAIHYRDGHTCDVDPPAALVTKQRAVIRRIQRLPGHGLVMRRGQPGGLTPAAKKLLADFLTAEHLKPGWEQRYNQSCPPVGYVPEQEKRVTSAMVSTPITVRRLPNEYGEITVDITFKARQAVTNSSNWYEDYFTNPAGCPSGGQGGEIEFGNIRAGSEIHDKRLLGSCEGTYHGLIGYMQNSEPIDQNSSGGGQPGKDGSVVVGRFSLTVH